jgi:hypothetical protein
MRVDGPNSTNPIAAQRAKKLDANAPAFELPGTQKAKDTRSAAAAPSAAGLDALLTLQMIEVIEDPLSKKKKGLKRGRAMLDALDNIKIALLTGRLPQGDLQQLVVAVEGRERDSDDPRLEELLDEIELRAKVELAKIEALTPR